MCPASSRLDMIKPKVRETPPPSNFLLAAKYFSSSSVSATHRFFNMETNFSHMSYPVAIAGFKLCIASESFNGIYHLHFLDLSVADNSCLVHAKLNSLCQQCDSSWMSTLKRRISHPVVYQGKVRRVHSSFLFYKNY